MNLEKTKTNSGPQNIEEMLCYHCGTKESALLYCELWMVTACKSCIDTHHHVHHPQCKRDLTRNKKPELPKRALFRVTLTRFDGSKVGLLMRLGDSLTMEAHWAGTYILAPQMLLLVTEDIATINKSILAGLRSVTTNGRTED